MSLDGELCAEVKPLLARAVKLRASGRNWPKGVPRGEKCQAWEAGYPSKVHAVVPPFLPSDKLSVPSEATSVGARCGAAVFAVKQIENRLSVPSKIEDKLSVPSEAN